MNEELNVRNEFLNIDESSESTIVETMAVHRILPEYQLLSKMIHEQRIDILSKFALKSEVIIDPRARRIYEDIIELNRKREDNESDEVYVPDVLTIVSKFGTTDEDKQMLMDSLQVSSDIPDVVLRDELWESYMFAQAASMLTQASSLIESNAIEGIRQLDGKLSNLRHRLTLKPAGMDIIAEAKARLAEYEKKSSKDNWFIPTGFSELNNKVKGWAPGEELVVIVARTGVGKEQPLYAKVLTPTGWKTMGEIKPGDVVTGGDGLPAKVVEVFPQGVKPVYRFEFDDHTFVDAGLEHLWSVRSVDDRKLGRTNRVVTTKYIMDHIEEDFTIDLVQPVSYLNPTDECIDPYLLGVLLSSSTVISEKNIFIKVTDKTVRNLILKAIQPFGCKLKNRKNGSFIVSGSLFGRNKLCEEILRLTKNRDSFYFLPSFVQTASNSYRMRVLLGFLEASEHCDISTHTMKVAEKNLQKAVSIQALMNSLGVWNSFSDVDNREYVISYQLPVNLYNTQILSDNWNSNVKTCRHIVSVKYLNDHECKCIMVDNKDHTYITDNFTITHNTWVLTKMLQEAWKQQFNVGLIEPEMTGNKIGYRFDAINGHFSNRKLTYGDSLTDEGKDKESYIQYLHSLVNDAENGKVKKFMVAHPKDFGGTVTVSDIKYWCICNDIKVLGIDGISYMKDERGKSSDNTTTALTNISADLMELSIELGIPVIVVVQSNRGSAENGGIPSLETIRDSDGIAYSASQVISVYVKHDLLHLKHLKNRNGESNFTLSYDWDIDKGTMQYVDYDPADYEDDASGAGNSSSQNKNRYERNESSLQSQRPERTANSYEPTRLSQVNPADSLFTSSAVGNGSAENVF